MGVPLPVSDIQDSLIWSCTSSGKFSMQSATWLAHGIHPSSASLWPYAWIWKLDTMPKILVFIWQLCRNALPVRLLLQSRGVDLDPLCPLCGQSNESMQHLFLACPNTLRVWDAAEDHNWIPRGFLWGTHAEIAGLLLTWQQHPLQLIRQRISFLLWSIWKARNNVVFNHEAFHPITCLIKAKRAGAEWRTWTRLPADSFPGGTPSSPRHKSHRLVRWFAPPPGFVKLNFDGSCRGFAAPGGFILRDWRGQPLQIGAFNYGSATITVAEAKAMHDGILHSLCMGYRPIIVEGDNRTVIGAILCSSGVPWRIQGLIHDIQRWRQVGIQLTFKHIYREVNRAADWIANFGHSLSHSFVTDSCFSSALSVIVGEDVVGRAFVKKAA